MEVIIVAEHRSIRLIPQHRLVHCQPANRRGLRFLRADRTALRVARGGPVEHRLRCATTHRVHDLIEQRDPTGSRRRVGVVLLGIRGRCEIINDQAATQREPLRTI